jgi:hypothetical protein
VGVVAFVDAGTSQHRPRRAKHRKTFKQARVGELVVIQLQRKLFDFLGAELVAHRRRGDDRPDDRSG